MKAVPVLLCLALAHGISASIFKQVDSFVNDQLEYIDQLRQHRNQPSDNEKQHSYQQVRDEQRDQRQPQEELQRAEKRIQPAQELEQQRKQQPHKLQWDQSGETKNRVSSEELNYGISAQQPQYRQHSEEFNYGTPAEQHQYRQQSEELNYGTPAEQRYRQQSEDSKYRNPAEQPGYRQQSEEPRYMKASDKTTHRQLSEGYKYRPQYTQPEQYQQYEDTAYQQVKNQHSYAQHSHEQDMERYSTYQQTPESHNKPNHYRPLTSTNENSQESQENKQSNENVKSNLHIDIQKWVPEKVRDAVEYLNEKKNTYTDVIAKNVQNVAQMAVDPIATVEDTVGVKKIFGDALSAMKHVSNEVKEQLHKSFEAVKQQENDPIVLNATQLAQKHNYAVEEHTIKTDDGYEITLFRIPPKKQIRDVQKRPVVFLMHGIDGSADDWLLLGPGKSLAYLLSNAGFDVWLGNARGNKYARHHVSKSPALSGFWEYSIDEIALHDLPAMINYVLKTTQQEKLTYIGHSLGTTTFFALTAARPEYNDKIKMMYAFSPMVYMSHVRSPLMRMISSANSAANALDLRIGNTSFNPVGGVIKAVGGAMLEKVIGLKELSSNVNFVMAGVNIDNLEPQVIAMMLRHLPAGTSTKVIKQYGQGVASQEFRKYDFGSQINQQVYGSEQPPKYNMEKVQAPVALYYSEDDWLAHPKDVERLVKELPNVKESHKVTEPHFSNMDFQFSKEAPEMVYRRVIECMQSNQ